MFSTFSDFKNENCKSFSYLGIISVTIKMEHFLSQKLSKTIYLQYRYIAAKIIKFIIITPPKNVKFFYLHSGPMTIITSRILRVDNSGNDSKVSIYKIVGFINDAVSGCQNEVFSDYSTTTAVFAI